MLGVAGNEAAPPFPLQLYGMLHSDQQHLGNIVSFLPHGRAFVVHNIERFSNDVLPVWFMDLDWEAFQHRLRLFGFHRITQGPDQGAFYNECFLRGRYHLARSIQEGRVPRQVAPEDEPNFDTMPWIDAVAAGTAQPAEHQQQQHAPADLTMAGLQASAGGSALPPGAIGYPVLPRLMIPSQRETETGIQSNSAMLDQNFLSEDELHEFLRANKDEEEEDERKEEHMETDQDQDQDHHQLN
ncbi:shock factor protein HSF8 [Seminavis robusta]|uniref:Shock factor protein HSF8 n=1 Tax=Seminavis robusta TaxID=568900 RepID=A0A9N8EKN1_9STRA|nr:shock factor protein HSF8 [Seminavis robusta]|eukprot:Sro1156_g247300.1 shock factor protein HSF8 (241) ;mRNA; f:27641-28752